MTTLIEAQSFAEAQLAESLPRRWNHVQAVGQKAGDVAPLLLTATDAVVVEAAAWLHDIGYAPDLAISGFHPLDGARWLRQVGVDNRIVCLVAHHSCAVVEAEERGILATLQSEFANEQSKLTEILLYADMTTGPDGRTLKVEERLGEIESRYGPDDLITRFIRKARHNIIDTVHRVEVEIDSMSQPRYGAPRSS